LGREAKKAGLQKREIRTELRHEPHPGKKKKKNKRKDANTPKKITEGGEKGDWGGRADKQKNAYCLQRGEKKKKMVPTSAQCQGTKSKTLPSQEEPGRTVETSHVISKDDPRKTVGACRCKNTGERRTRERRTTFQESEKRRGKTNAERP